MADEDWIEALSPEARIMVSSVSGRIDELHARRPTTSVGGLVEEIRIWALEEVFTTFQPNPETTAILIETIEYYEISKPDQAIYPILLLELCVRQCSHENLCIIADRYRDSYPNVAKAAAGINLQKATDEYYMER